MKFASIFAQSLNDLYATTLKQSISYLLRQLKVPNAKINEIFAKNISLFNYVLIHYFNLNTTNTVFSKRGLFESFKEIYVDVIAGIKDVLDGFLDTVEDVGCSLFASIAVDGYLFGRSGFRRAEQWG